MLLKSNPLSSPLCEPTSNNLNKLLISTNIVLIPNKNPPYTNEKEKRRKEIIIKKSHSWGSSRGSILLSPYIKKFSKLLFFIFSICHWFDNNKGWYQTSKRSFFTQFVFFPFSPLEQLSSHFFEQLCSFSQWLSSHLNQAIRLTS